MAFSEAFWVNNHQVEKYIGLLVDLIQKEVAERLI